MTERGMFPVKATLWLTVGTALVLGLGGLWKAREAALAKAERAALRADSLEAVLDTTRLTAGQAAMWERRAVQGEVAQDSLSRALGREVRATAALRLRLSAGGDVGGQTQDSAGVHLVTLEGEAEGVVLSVEAVIPHGGGTPVGRWSVRLPPVPLTFRVECGVAPPDGVRPAIVRADVRPPYQVQTIEAPRVAPDVCARGPEATRPDAFQTALSWVGTAGAGAMAGALVAPADEWARGAALGAAVTVGVRLALKAVGLP